MRYDNDHPVSKMLREHFAESDVFEFEGVLFRRDHSPLQPGDTYIAGRNTGPHLLTVKRVMEDRRFVMSEENAYPYDSWECYKVVLAEDTPQWTWEQLEQAFPAMLTSEIDEYTKGLALLHRE